jgi:hypothetical protein
MANRFSGDVMLGGQLTQAQFDKCMDMIEPCLEEGLDEDGSGYFHDCTDEDFAEVANYCLEQKIAFCIQWEAKWEMNGYTEYWIDGKYKQFASDNYGNIVVSVNDLEAKAKETPQMTIKQYVDALDIPEFPEFLIVEPCQYCGGQTAAL